MSGRLLFEREIGGVIRRVYGREDGDDLEIFAEGIHGVSTTSTHVKLNLFSVAPSSEENVERRQVVCRLVLPITTFISVADFLHEHAETLRKQMVKIDEAGLEMLKTQGQGRRAKRKPRRGGAK